MSVPSHVLCLAVVVAPIAAIACHHSPPAPIIIARSEQHVYPRPTRAQLDSFTLDVAMPTDSGECVRRPMVVGVGRMVSVYYPDQRNAVAVAVVTLDTAGRIVRFHDDRGRAVVHGMRGATREQLDSIFAEAKRRTRNSSVYLDYVTGQAILENDGGGLPDQRMMVPLAAVLNEVRFGYPGMRARQIVARCASAGRPASATAFEFQVDKPAAYVGATSISPHPVPGGGGTTVVQFVVDSTGAIRPGMFKVLRTERRNVIPHER